MDTTVRQTARLLGEADRRFGDRGAGALPVAESTGHALVGLRSRRVNEPGTWGLFGGKVEPGERLKEAALREMREELGVDVRAAMVGLHVHREATADGGEFAFHNFAAFVADEFEPDPNWEVAATKWVPADDIAGSVEPLHFGLEALLSKAGERLDRLVDERTDDGGSR